MALIQVDPSIWVIPGVVKFSKKNTMPCRATLIRLSDGKLWLHSPVKLTPEDIQQIQGLGDVAYLVAPNNYHHLFFGAAAEAFPQAQTWAPAGLERKRPDLTFSHQLGTGAAPWTQDIQTMPIDGAPKISEWAFYHGASDTLVVTDVLFNFNPDELSGGTRLLVKMMGAYGMAAQSRTWRLMVKDRKAHQRSLQNLLELPIKRLIMAHGEIIDAHAHARTEAALARGLSLFKSSPKPYSPS